MPPPASDESALVGLRIRDRYRVISELGTGAFGTVYLAEDESGSHEIAIRILPRELADRFQPGQTRRRMIRSIVEASTAHPALVRVLEFGETETGQAFAAMELVHGRRLSQILSEGRLEIDTALRLAVDLGGAVETLHNMGLVHGALRPRNVMVGNDGRVTLLDVELTGLRTAQRVEGMVPDVPPAEYLSPEQVHHVQVTETTEIYSFAVMLYEMLSGTPPFQAESREAVLQKHLTETPVPLRRRRHAISSPVESIIGLALSKRPEQRPSMQTILNRLWEEANRPTKRWKRMDVLIAGGALAAALTVVGAFSLHDFGPSAPSPSPVSLPEPPAVVREATIPAPPISSAAPSETSTEPSPGKVTPAVVPPPPVRSISPPPTSPPRRVERQEQPRVQRAPETVVRERPAASVNPDDPDPGAVVDWLLERRGRRGQ